MDEDEERDEVEDEETPITPAPFGKLTTDEGAPEPPSPEGDSC